VVPPTPPHTNKSSYFPQLLVPSPFLFFFPPFFFVLGREIFLWVANLCNVVYLPVSTCLTVFSSPLSFPPSPAIFTVVFLFFPHRLSLMRLHRWAYFAVCLQAKKGVPTPVTSLLLSLFPTSNGQGFSPCVVFPWGFIWLFLSYPFSFFSAEFYCPLLCGPNWW